MCRNFRWFQYGCITSEIAETNGLNISSNGIIPGTND
jgi:hypothetical protein